MDILNTFFHYFQKKGGGVGVGGGGVIGSAGKRKHRFALYIHGIVVPGNLY